MPFDLHLEESNETFREHTVKNIARDAAIYIVNGQYTRAEAIAEALELNRNQHEAMSDSTGVHGTLAESNFPKWFNTTPTAQIHAIACDDEMLELAGESFDDAPY